MNTKDWSTTKKEFESEKLCNEEEDWKKVKAFNEKFKGLLTGEDYFEDLSPGEFVRKDEESIFKGDENNEFVIKIELEDSGCKSGLKPIRKHIYELPKTIVDEQILSSSEGKIFFSAMDVLLRKLKESIEEIDSINSIRNKSIKEILQELMK